MQRARHEATTKKTGLAVIGCGTIGHPGRVRPGLSRHRLARLCDTNAEVGQKFAEDAKADFFTTDYNELLKRPEVTAAIIATDEQEASLVAEKLVSSELFDKLT